ncbi:hypothetical protein HYS82_01190 [Candidatus Amesbacteria bacterium]|nr:hypothetical protein [Candidatus Amesbacteria bacterium]MBI2587228.1 hypothetical protein [Candidatus Amesbacteria bacterium]
MPKSFRFYLRFISALIGRHNRELAIGLFLGTAAFLILPQILRRLPPVRTTRSIGLVAQPTLSNLPLFIQNQVSLGLTSLDDTGLPVPALASSWTATDSGKTYIFDIQTGLHWQDGQPLSSPDIKYNFKDAQVEYPDSSHLKILLPDPFSPLPSAVTRPVFKKKLIGIGSYRIVKYRLNGPTLESLTLSPVIRNSATPNLHYSFYASENQARLAYKLGLVKTLLDIQDPKELKTWPGADVSRRTLSDRYVAVFFNIQDPIFAGTAGRNLRQALSYAIDKSRWPGTSRAVGPLASDSWAFSPEVKKYDFDLDHAQLLLTKVDKLPDLLTLTTVPAYLPIAEDIKKDWQALGIDVQIQVSLDIPADYQALLLAQAIPVDPDQYSLWHSIQPANITKLNHPRIDKLLEDGRKTSDLPTRRAIYADFQKFLLEESPAIFLFHPHTYTISRQ